MLHLLGPLGAGKTTLCRAYVRTAVGDESLDVPSPTFLLKHTYDTPAGTPLAHVDLYRLDLGCAPARLELPRCAQDGALLLEWADRLSSEDATRERLDIFINPSASDGGGDRLLTLIPAAVGRWPTRLDAFRRVLAVAEDEQTAGLTEAALSTEAEPSS